MDVVELPPHLSGDAVSLWHRAGLTRPWNDPHADLALALSSPSSTVLAVVEDDLPVGTVMVGHDGHRGWVYYLAVDPARRRRGVASALVRAAERWVAERGVPKLQLMVRHGNEEALALYAALGYEVVDVTVLGRRLDS